jgi:AraC family transcriptional activator FtrA
LERRFLKATDASVFEWINRERVNQTKVQLETTDLRFAEIATLVGFGSAETLRRNFDKTADISTSLYRSSFRPQIDALPS